LSRHLAQVDRRANGEYFVTTSSFDHRLAILDGPAIVLAADSATEDLGAATLAALLRSGTITAPDDRREQLPAVSDLLKRAGVKTWTGYMRGTKSVGVFAEFEGSAPSAVELTPQQKEGGHGAQVPVTEKIVSVPYSTTAALGAAVSAALDDATT
jgi:hypothetical protein